MKTSPLIDGKIDSDEWKNASWNFGALHLGTDNLAKRNAVFYIGYDSENLYFACKSELPPEDMALMSRVRLRDGKVYADDAVEFIILPPHKKYVYQFIANSLGTFFDTKYPVSRGSVCTSDQKDWNPQAKSASSFRNGNWEIEVLMPLKDLEITELPLNEEWRIQMTRDWRQPGEASSWSRSGNFCDPETMGIMVMDTEVPAVHFLGLGSEWRMGDLDIGLSVFNGTAASRRVECDLSIVSDGPPRALNKKEEVESQRSLDWALKYTEKAHMVSLLALTVKEENSGKILMQRGFRWENGTGKIWENKATEANTDLEFAYYPYHKLIKYRIEPRKMDDEISSLMFCVKQADGQTTIAETKGEKKNNVYLAESKLSELQEGEYLAVCDILLKDGKKKTFTKKFEVKHFPWEHNNIGLEKVIVPPFKPLKTDPEKKEVMALMTGYRLDGLFWDRIYSQDENILASPIKLVINGKDLLNDTASEFSEIADHAVSAKNSAHGSGLLINGKHDYDYDGMCKVTLDIIPSGKLMIENAYLEIPLKKSAARLMHTMHNTMKNHPADFIPDGTGVVWDSTMGFQNDEIRGNFRPYFWMGDVYKGLCWFTQSDKNWSLDHDKAAIQIIRSDDKVTLRINIVNNPCDWENPFSLVMGFQATPVKPRMNGWRRISERLKFKDENNIVMATLAGSNTWGTDGLYDQWPAGKDYSIIRKLSKQNRKDSAKNTADIIPFIQKHFQGISKEKYNFIERHLQRARTWGAYADFLVPYLNPTASEMSWDEYKTYMDEWWYSNYRANTSDDYNNEPCRSYQDMLLFNTRELVRNGLDGIYYDNIRDRTSYDMTTGPAYEFPDGKIQPYFTIFSVRELLKRTYTMLYLEGKTILDDRPLLVTHMTNTNIVPCMSFSTITLDLEAKYGPTDFQDRFSESWLLSTTIGTQTGCAPEILVQITGDEKEFVTRTFLAVTLAYDLPFVMDCGGLTSIFKNTWEKIRKFGYGSDAVAVFACWDKNNPVNALSPNTRISTYIDKKEKKALLVFSDFGNGGKAAANISNIGFDIQEISDFESGTPVSFGGNILETELKKHDFKIFMVTGEK